jgi:hypothetical protein
MTLELLIDEIERAYWLELGKALPVDHMVVQNLIEQALVRLASQEQLDVLKASLEPFMQTEPSVREYSLPEDFPSNFLRYKDPDTGQTEWACKLDDSNSAWALDWEPPEVFYRRDLSAETAAQPTAYTITRTPNGSKQLVLAPPPNTTSYTISGVYMPASFDLDRDSLPSVSPELLRFEVLKRLAPDNQSFQAAWRDALGDLYYSEAQTQDGGFSVESDDYIERF